jgi:hypothetical protein
LAAAEGGGEVEDAAEDFKGNAAVVLEPAVRYCWARVQEAEEEEELVVEMVVVNVQQASAMEMAKLGGRLSRWSGSTVRNLKSAAVRINLTCTRVRVSPRPSAVNLMDGSRFTIERQKTVSSWNW